MGRTQFQGADHPRETTSSYAPPDSPEADGWWVPAIKFAVALSLSAACGTLGLSGTATAVIAASFLVVSPPVAALQATMLRVLAMRAGATMGTVGALWGPVGGQRGSYGLLPLLGAVVGITTSRDSTLIYTVAIAAVVASAGAAGEARARRGRAGDLRAARRGNVDRARRDLGLREGPRGMVGPAC